jgi:hypothetical protein
MSKIGFNQAQIYLGLYLNFVTDVTKTQFVLQNNFTANL